MPDVTQSHVGEALKGRSMFQLPSGNWTQYWYCGLEQPVELAEKCTVDPNVAEVLDGERVALVQPVSVIVLEPIASDRAVELPVSLAQTWTVKTPGARPAVLQSHVGSALNARSMFQLPSRYWTQYSYWGAEQPVELAVK